MKQKKRRRALWLIPLVLLAGGAAGWYYLRGQKAQTASTVVQQRTATVERGVLNVTLSGSGSVYPAVTVDIKAEATGTVKENFMEEEKLVKTGDVLLTLEEEDTSISDKKLQNTLVQKQLAYEKLVEQADDYNIISPIGGEITELLVNVGEEVKSGANLMTITDMSVLTAEVSFENTSAATLEDRQVLLHLPDYMTTLSAAIRSVEQDGSNTTATVVVENPGSLKPGVKVWCEANGLQGTLTSTDGVLQWNQVETVTAEVSGEVQSLTVEKGSKVGEGLIVAVLYDDEAEINLENVRLQVEEAQYNIEQSRVDRTQYQLTAAADGYLTSVKEIEPGDSVKEGEVLASTINFTEMEFSISIDELDINQVVEGQEVLVTVEAIESTQNKPLRGKVSGIALEGKTSNGVTTYPVTITVPGTEGLKIGMNVDAGIQVVNRENVLLVPLEALQKRGDSYMVWVKTGETDSTTTVDADNATMPQGGGFQRMTEEQREAMRQRMENMTEEERQAMRQQMGGVAGRGTAPGQGSIPDRSGEAAGEGGRNQTQNGSTGNSYYEGATLVTVETGLYNENYMEVISGLNEGDIVVLPQQTSNTAAESEQQTTGGFRIPGMGGGMMGGGSFGGGGRP